MNLPFIPSAMETNEGKNLNQIKDVFNLSYGKFDHHFIDSIDSNTGLKC